MMKIYALMSTMQTRWGSCDLDLGVYGNGEWGFSIEIEKSSIASF